MQFDVFLRLAHQELHRAVEAQRFFDGSVDQLRLAPQPLPQVRPVGQHVQQIAEQVRGGFVSGDQQQDVEADDLLLGKTHTVDLGVRNRTEEVARRMGLTLRDQLAKELRHLHQLGLARRGGRAGQRSGERVGPALEIGLARFRNAHHPRDDGDGQRRGESIDDVEVATERQRLDEIVGYPRDIGFDALQHRRRERLVHDRTQLRVARRIVSQRR